MRTLLGHSTFFFLVQDHQFLPLQLDHDQLPQLDEVVCEMTGARVSRRSASTEEDGGALDDAAALGTSASPKWGWLLSRSVAGRLRHAVAAERFRHAGPAMVWQAWGMETAWLRSSRDGCRQEDVDGVGSCQPEGLL